MGFLYLWLNLWESWELLYTHESLCVWTVEFLIVSLCLNMLSDWVVLVDCFVNMYVVNLRMLIICTCISVGLCGQFIVTCMLYRPGRVYFVSKDEREMWQIVSWECGILVVNSQVVIHAFSWLEIQLFEEACFVNLCLDDGLYTNM